MQNPRLDTLAERHAKLDREIVNETRKAGSDDLHISHLKRERLSLKDQLAALQS